MASIPFLNIGLSWMSKSPGSVLAWHIYASFSSVFGLCDKSVNELELEGQEKDAHQTKFQVSLLQDFSNVSQGAAFRTEVRSLYHLE